MSGGGVLRRASALLALVARAGVYAASAAAFAFPLSGQHAVWGAALGAALGVLGGAPLARSPLRSWTLAALVALGWVVSVGALHADLAHAWLVTSIEPAVVLQRIQQATFFSSALWLGLGLSALSTRHRMVTALEVVLSAASVAALVMGHRHGAINRPFEIADPIIASGGDPTIAILGVGVAAAVLAIAVMLRERGALRSMLHVLVAALLLFLVFKTTRYLGLPQPPSGGGLGLRGQEPQKPQEQAGQGSRSAGNANNDDLEFRDDNSPSRNQAPVAVVLLHDDYSPPRGLYYFRQGAFSQYNGRRLVGATRADADTDLIPAFASASITLPDVPGADGARATLDTTVALMADHARPFALEAPQVVKPEPNPDPSRFRRVYRVTSAALTADEYALLGHDVYGQDWSAALRDHYTRGPDDPRYAKLAQEILSGVREDLRQEPAVKALAITEWLGREGTYSLKTKHAAAEDPTADFLFGDKVGYCVHFAHAAAYLLRSAGVPTRVATGYVVDESARQGGSAMVLTSANSHAWPEIFVDGVGWVVMDIAPERTLDPPPPPPDPDLQRLLGQLARGEQPTADPRARDLQPMIAALRHALDLALRAGAVALLLTLVMLYVVKAWRRVVPMFAQPGQLARLSYRAQLDRLAEARLSREPGESRESFATRVHAVAPSFVRLTQHHVAAAFGSQRNLPAPELRAIARQSRAELHEHTRWWRRWLGLLTPWSWLRAR